MESKPNEFNANVEPITFDRYVELAQRTSNTEIAQDKILNGLMGLCGEAGEAIDIMKKVMFQGHDLDLKHLTKELGDVAWYLAEAVVGLTMMHEQIGVEMNPSFVLIANIVKLQERYPEGFNPEQSMNRKEGDE